MNKTILTILLVVVVGVGGFYGGTVYEKSSLSKQGLLRSANSAGGMRSGQGGTGQGGQGRGIGMGANGGFVTGQIISKDPTSITIKTRDGSSRIVYYSSSTSIGKSTSGSADDLTTGQTVMVGGTTSSDGSMTAQNIQIRPDMPAGSAPGQGQ